MSEAYPMPLPTKDFNAARHQFVELYGSIAVMNTYLKIAVLALAGVCVGLILLDVDTNRRAQNLKPIVIRINEVGRAEAISYGSLEYHPQEAELKYFLIEFVQRHYSRIHTTVRENFARSLYFLDGRLADAIMQSDKKTKGIESFLAGQSDEIAVNVKNVSLEDLRTPPYRATVDFEKVYSGADHMELKREQYVAHFVFIVRDHVPNDMIPINPLGLTITYFREDQAFE